MLQITPAMRIFVCNQVVDFRKGIDGLVAFCKNKLDQDPFQGALFVFRNRTCTTIRFLIYDGQGFWLCTKRLSQGKFELWPENISSIDARQLQVLLWNDGPKLISSDLKKVSVP